MCLRQSARISPGRRNPWNPVSQAIAAPAQWSAASPFACIAICSATAERADGITLDFHDGPAGGIAIDNPNEPPTVRRLDVHGYKAMRDNGAEHHLIDVRTAGEWATARIEGAKLLEQTGPALFDDIDPADTIVLMCHHGMRSMQAAGQLLAQGYRNVYNLEGGIDAWSIHIDNAIPRY